MTFYRSKRLFQQPVRFICKILHLRKLKIIPPSRHNSCFIPIHLLTSLHPSPHGGEGKGEGRKIQRGKEVKEYGSGKSNWFFQFGRGD
jgi:hypothetical protein